MTEFLNGRLDALTICKTAVGWHDARGCFGINGIYNAKGRGSAFIPTRSCQKFSKQICLWDLAQIIGILFIIQIVEAI